MIVVATDTVALADCYLGAVRLAQRHSCRGDSLPVTQLVRTKRRSQPTSGVA
jgi:hypothetical protein